MGEIGEIEFVMKGGTETDNIKRSPRGEIGGIGEIVFL